MTSSLTDRTVCLRFAHFRAPFTHLSCGNRGVLSRKRPDIVHSDDRQRALVGELTDCKIESYERITKNRREKCHPLRVRVRRSELEHEIT